MRPLDLPSEGVTGLEFRVCLCSTMNKLAGRNVTFMVLIAISILCASFATCYAREGKHWRLVNVHHSSEIGIEQKGHGHGKHHGKHKKPPPPGKVLPPSPPSPSPMPEPTPAPEPEPAPVPPSPSPPPPEPVPEPKPAPEPEPVPVPPSPSPLPPKPAPIPPPSPGHKSSTFNVLDFGAKGDGESDDTKAFLSAWSATCKVKASTLVVPSDSEFLVKPVSFLGPCQPGITFQLDGTIIAPTTSSAWGKGVFSWIEFKKLSKITIEGTGTIDGRGSVWYNGLMASDGEEEFEGPSTEISTNSPNDMDSVNLSKMPKQKPTALRFYGSDDVTVTGITIQDSPQTHLKFDGCTNVLVFDFSASSPGDSPNTDGIHLQNSQNVLIRDSNLACGDDCVSIQTGCSNIDIHDVNCGPGHGFSIGGLGKDNTKACVSDVTVHDCTISNTMTGVRIKTWQGGSGSAQNIMFSNIQMSEVKTPIVIDQFYCDKSKCKNQTSAVAVSRITYENIKGTYTVQPVRFACSDSTPCREITLDNIQLKPAQDGHHMYGPFCYQTYGVVKTATTPPIDCLEKGNPSPGSSKTDSCQA